MKRIIFLVALMTVVVGLRAQHRLDSLFIWVVIQPNGDAYVEEDRTMWLDDQGTEVYEKQYGLAERLMGIKDFGVRDDVYGEYERVDWDVNAGRQWKAGRCGINNTEQGAELCWGFGEPGPHKFTTYYTLQNLVQSYTDNDGFNHCFYDASNPPAHYVSVLVWAADSTLLLSKENTGIWHFQYHGEAYFTKGGCALFESTQQLEQGHKVVVMMQFGKGLFQPLIQHEETFAERVKERAFIDSDYSMDDPGDGGGTKASMYGGNDTSWWENFIYAAIGVFVFVGLPIFAVLAIIFKKPIERRRRRKRILEVLGNPDEIPYHREVPLGGKLIRSQEILRDVLGMLVGNKPNFGIQELTEALLLRLLYKGNIEITTEQTANGDLREVFRIKPVEQRAEDPDLDKDEEMECGLQRLLYDAAGSDHLLQPNELKIYIRDEKNTLAHREFAKRLNQLTVVSMYGIENSFRKVKHDEAREVFGFWQYLNDFSIIGEREVVEVHLWKDYLVFASLYGIAKKVREGMKKILPDYNSLDKLTQQFIRDNSEMYAYVGLLSVATYDSIRYSSSYETMAERAAREAREAAARRSSGGGGRSSFGGGGGYSGGGGSGVR